MTDTTAADALVAETRRAIHESLVLLPAPEADRVRSLIADLETAVEGRTAIRFSAAPESATDRAALRDRIAETLYRLTPVPGIPWDQAPESDRRRLQRHADAVLAVLPPPTDRGAVLRDAADRLDAAAAQQDSLSSSDYDQEAYAARQLREQAAGVRRMADEAQAAEAHPAEHTWAAELYDPVAKEWVPGTRYPDRDRAVNHLNHAAKIGPAWKDGTPTQRRLVRATTTYTVEQPAAGARQDGVQQ